jgi:hypothetical protein
MYQFPSYVRPWQAAERQSKLRFHFARCSTAVIFRKTLIRPHAAVSDRMPSGLEPGLFIGNNEAFGIG